VTHRDIKRETGIDPNFVYLNNLFWTPRFYQQPALSTEFEHELKKFKNLQLWEDKDILALTHLILIEATRDTTFDVSFGFKAKPSVLSQFHGRIDCLMYQRYGGEDIGVPDLKDQKDKNDFERGIGFPLVPVFFPVQKSQEYTPFKEESFPLTQIVSCGQWCLEHMSDVDPSIEYVRLLHTDGHRWKLYEVHRSHVKKTKFFEPSPSLRSSSNNLVRFSK
jgi:hypothetical protein